MFFRYNTLLRVYYIINNTVLNINTFEIIAQELWAQNESCFSFCNKNISQNNFSLKDERENWICIRGETAITSHTSIICQRVDACALPHNGCIEDIFIVKLGTHPNCGCDIRYPELKCSNTTE